MSYVPAWLVKPLIGLGIAAALGGACYWYGRGDGRDAQAKDDAKVIAKAEKRAGDAATALRAAAVRLSADARVFREIDAETAANMEAADKAVAEAQRLAKGAADEAAEFEKRMAKLEERMAGERETCTDGRKPICGVPLR